MTGAAKRTDNETAADAEFTLRGHSVSKGVAIGKAVCLYGVNRQYYRIKLKDGEIAAELKRIRAAVRLAKLRLKKISHPGNEKSNSILDIQFLMLEDGSLIRQIENLITAQKVNAEWAVKEVSDKYLAAYKAIQDEYLRERYVDLEDVTERLMGALDGGTQTSLSFSDETIVVARELKPSTMIELLSSGMNGIITESGGWTSHAFILAREHGIPANAGMKNVLRHIKTGDLLIVDGNNGTVHVNPPEDILLLHAPAAKHALPEPAGHLTKQTGKFTTTDGHEVLIRVNADTAISYQEAKRQGACGIGLYRSEFLVNRDRGFPSEKIQLKEYSQIAAETGNDGVRIRTFDVGAAQISDDFSEKEKNPALGLRAIRLVLANEKIFRTQIRALLRAAHGKKLHILLPMISDVEEIIRAKRMIAEERKALRGKGLPAGRPKIGAMIEVPSAVLMADEIAAEVDFLSLGTNDLVQYLLAVDRDNETVAEWFRTLHPAVLRSVNRVLEAGRKRGIPVIVCGEMSGSPVYSAILVGLGATELSMSVKAIPRVLKVINGISKKHARTIAKNLLKCRTSDEAETLVREEFFRRWPETFPVESLPQARA